MKRPKSREKRRKRHPVDAHSTVQCGREHTAPWSFTKPDDPGWDYSGIDSSSPRDLYLKGREKLERKRRIEALRLLEKAAALDPTDGEYASAVAELRNDIRTHPTTSLCMMVKNEEDNLSRCLESVDGTVDEIIVVDTGSSDRTMDIARRYDVCLYEHPWFDDFSGMRNITIGYAHGDWILILDADEELETQDRELIRTVAMDISHNGKYFQVHNRLEDGAKDWVCESVRMFRNDGEIHYEGIVHNNIIIFPPIQSTPVRIHHYGYDLDEAKKAGKFKRTTSLLNKILTETPDDARAVFYLMKSHGSVGQKEKVIEYGERFLELADRQKINLAGAYWHEVFWSLSAAWIASGDPAKGEHYIRKGLELDPDYPDLYHLLANIRGTQGKFEEVKDYSRMAIERLERHARGQVTLHYMEHYARHEVLSCLAAACYELGEYEEALSHCEEAIRGHDGKAEYHLLRARVLLKQGIPEEAQRSLEIAGRLNPGLGTLKVMKVPPPERTQERFQEGLSALQRNDVPTAISLFHDVLNADPSHPGAHGWLARLYCGQGELEAALRHARASLHPGRNELGMLALGEISLKKEDFPAAVEHLLECAKEFPESPHANHLLGIAFWRRGRRLQGIPYLEKAVSLEPSNGGYRQALEKAQLDMGSQPTISLCMMVKNEANNLERLLKSVEGAADEIVIVDTGSTDSTMDIARRYHVRLYEHPWFHDFSGMRNITIGYGRGDWILILDADEELVAEDRKLVRDISMDTSVNGFQFVVHNQFAKAGHDFKGRSVRLFKNDGGIRYEGIVHNDLVIGPPIRNTAVRLNHYGYDLDAQRKEVKFERTSVLLHKMIEEQPEYAPAHFYLLKAYAGHGEKDKAIACGEKFFELALNQNNPKNHLFRMEAYYLLGMLHLTLRRLDKARIYAEDGIAYCSYYPDNYFLLAKVEGREKNYAQAREYGSQALEYLEQYERGETHIMCIVHPSRHEILLDLATACHELGEYEEAFERCREGVVLAPNTVPLNMLMAKIQLKRGNGREGLEALAVVEELDPDYHDLRYHQGRCLLTMERYQEAHSMFIRYLEKRPDNASAHHYLGKLELKWRRFDKAEVHLARAAELDPRDADLHNELALVLEHNGKMHEALNAFERMHSIDSNVEGLRNKIGEVAFTLGDAPKARHFFLGEIEHFPHVSTAYNNLAVLLAGEGKVEEALECLNKCLEIDPGNSTARDNLQELQSMIGTEIGAQAIN